jgi:hypothetical protein
MYELDVLVAHGILVDESIYFLSFIYCCCFVLIVKKKTRFMNVQSALVL